MSIKDILELEGDALAKTIMDYSTDNYIRNYALKLTQLHYPEQKEQILIVVTRLLDWYRVEIETIKSQQYVHNKEAHIKSYEILENLTQTINQ